MRNSKIYYGSINLSKLVKAVKENHPAVFKSTKTNDIYINFNLFVSDEKDKFKNHGAMCTSQSESEKDKSFYFANIKLNEKKEITEEDFNDLEF